MKSEVKSSIVKCYLEFTLLHRGISSCKAFIFSLILSRRFCAHSTIWKHSDMRKTTSNYVLMYVHTLSERLWTSAARDLFADVDPRCCFFSSRHSKSTSFCSKTRRDKYIIWNKNVYVLQKIKKRTNFWFMIVINLFSIFHGKPPTYYTILIRWDNLNKKH